MLETTETALRNDQMIACTPRAWARVSTILNAVPDKTLRDILIAGIVGEAVAAEFILIAEDIASTVQATDLIAAKPAQRAKLYPTNLHGLSALVYALVTLADRETIGTVIDVMAGIRHLARDREDPALAALPLSELCAYGFELLIEKALSHDLQEAFRGSASYTAYAAERAEIGMS